MALPTHRPDPQWNATKRIAWWVAVELAAFALFGQFFYGWPIMACRAYAAYDIWSRYRRDCWIESRVLAKRDIYQAQLAEPEPPPIASNPVGKR
jgi:hypothetical protein